MRRVDEWGVAILLLMLIICCIFLLVIMPVGYFYDVRYIQYEINEHVIMRDSGIEGKVVHIDTCAPFANDTLYNVRYMNDVHEYAWIKLREHELMEAH
jgi:hypothetical protein